MNISMSRILDGMTQDHVYKLLNIKQPNTKPMKEHFIKLSDDLIAVLKVRHVPQKEDVKALEERMKKRHQELLDEYETGASQVMEDDPVMKEIWEEDLKLFPEVESIRYFEPGMIEGVSRHQLQTLQKEIRGIESQDPEIMKYYQWGV